MKTISERQEEVQRESVLASNEIQSAMLEWQMAQNELTSPDYDASEMSAYKQKMSDQAKALLDSEQYKALKEGYGGRQPTLSEYTDKTTNADFMRRYSNTIGARDNFALMYPGGTEPDKTKYADEKQYEQAMEVYSNVKKLYEEYDTNPEYKMFEMENKYWTEAAQGLDRNKHKAEFADEYIKSRGLLNTQGLAERLKGAMERSRQTLES
jgi:hypothetical protein